MWAPGLVVIWGVIQAWGPTVVWLAQLWEGATSLRFLGTWLLALSLAWGLGYLSCLIILEGRLSDEVLRREQAEHALAFRHYSPAQLP